VVTASTTIAILVSYNVAPLVVGVAVVVSIMIGTAFIGLPGGKQLVTDLLSSNPLAVAAALVVLLAILTVPLTSGARRRGRAERWGRQSEGKGPSGDEPSRGLDYAGA